VRGKPDSWMAVSTCRELRLIGLSDYFKLPKSSFVDRVTMFVRAVDPTPDVERATTAKEPAETKDHRHSFIVMLIGERNYQPALGPRGGLWSVLLMCNP
jgi:hypothetical protein